jgi:ATP synthase protein I
MTGTPEDEPPAPASGDPWSVMSYLISGPALYGGLGWLLERWLHQPWLVPLGVIVGMGLALWLVYLRWGRV